MSDIFTLGLDAHATIYKFKENKNSSNWCLQDHKPEKENFINFFNNESTKNSTKICGDTKVEQSWKVEASWKVWESTIKRELF